MQGVRALQAFMKVNRVCYNEGKAALTSPAWLGLDENMRSVREAAASRLEYQLPIKVGVEYADVDKQKWMLRDMGTMNKLDAWVVKPGRNQDKSATRSTTSTMGARATAGGFLPIPTRMAATRHQVFQSV